MPLTIQSIRADIDKTYVGLNPDTTNVKPVHIANGLLRTLVGRTADTRLLNAFVVPHKNDGTVPEGHELETIYQWLLDQGRILPADVSKADLRKLRPLLRKVVNADEGVYLHRDQMESYTAGFQGFLSKDRIAQTGGELVAAWLQKVQSPLAECALQSISECDDPITLLSLPLLQDEFVSHTPKMDCHELPFLNAEIPAEFQDLWNGLAEAARTLSQHLVSHPNKLLRLRMITLFACLVLVRHLTCLEGYYVSGSNRVLPLLLDFSAHHDDPVAKASTMTYTYASQSLVRFYAWAFGRYLEHYYSPSELTTADYPAYKGTPSNDGKEIWDLARKEVGSSDQPYIVAGQALYDILAIEAEADPVRYLRQLGLRCGLLWPPENLRPAKRFAVQQDLLEVLLRATVEPGTVVDMPTLQERLWKRFGILVGGRSEDTERLVSAGVYQADADSLRSNRSRFAARLGDLGFARLLADGVLQVQLEVSHES